MLEKLKDRYKNFEPKEIEILIDEVPFKFKVIRKLSYVEKMTIVNSVLEIATSETEKGIKTFDNNLANVLLQLLIISRCTDLEFFNNNREDGSVEELLEIYDILTEFGVKEIISQISKTLCDFDIFGSLKRMLDEQLIETHRVLNIENSLSFQLINLLDNISDGVNSDTDNILEKFEVIKPLFEKLTKTMEMMEDKAEFNDNLGKALDEIDKIEKTLNDVEKPKKRNKKVSDK